MANERYWRKSYDPGLADLDPGLWETTSGEAVKEVYTSLADKTALAYLDTHISYAELDSHANRSDRDNAGKMSERLKSCGSVA